MSRDFDARFPRFRIGRYDRVTIEGAAYTLVQQTDDAFILAPAEGEGLPVVFPFAHLNRLNAEGKVRHEPEHLLPRAHRRTSVRQASAAQMGLLDTKRKGRLDVRHAFVQAFRTLEVEGRVRRSERSVEACMSEICETALPFLEAGADLERIDREARAAAGGGRRSMGGVVAKALAPVHPRTLLGWVRAEEAHGKAGLADRMLRRGNRTSRFTLEEETLMVAIVRRSWLDPNRPPKTQVILDVQNGFLAENERRAEAGLPPLTVPARKAVRARIAAIGAFESDLARRGPEEAMRRHRPVGRGIEVSRPLERVEIDENRVNLMTVMTQAGLAPLFSEEELAALGLDDGISRWWITLAVDCRTRVVLGMTLTKNPRTSSATSCLRMIVSDKGEISDATGAGLRWSQYGTPELLVADNGPAFMSIGFTDACNDLGIPLERTIAGVPAMRGTVERLFRTLSTGLAPRLGGRTFSNVVERAAHPSEARACLDPENFCFALVRWIVDIYHNTPHEGLGGRTPLRQWEEDHASGNFPLSAAPDARAKRLAFGLPLERVATKAGITVLGVRYHSEALARLVLDSGPGEVVIRWDPEDIGVIEALFAGEWREVPAVHDGFVGINAQVWLAARRKLRATTPRRKAWEADVVRRAIEAITAMNTERALQFRLLDKPFDAERLVQLESHLFDGFCVTETAPKTRACGDGSGISVLPRDPGADSYPGPLPASFPDGLSRNANPPRHDDPWRFDDEEG